MPLATSPTVPPSGRCACPGGVYLLCPSGQGLGVAEASPWVPRRPPPLAEHSLQQRP